MDARLIDADGNVLPPLPQRDMFRPIVVAGDGLTDDTAGVRAAVTTGRPLLSVGSAALQIIAELRAVLAPLLDDHMWILEPGGPFVCLFCETDPDVPHAPDCPVLRRDELLGR